MAISGATVEHQPPRPHPPQDRIVEPQQPAQDTGAAPALAIGSVPQVKVIALMVGAVPAIRSDFPAYAADPGRTVCHYLAGCSVSQPRR